MKYHIFELRCVFFLCVSQIEFYDFTEEKVHIIANIIIIIILIATGSESPPPSLNKKQLFRHSVGKISYTLSSGGGGLIPPLLLLLGAIDEFHCIVVLLPACSLGSLH